MSLLVRSDGRYEIVEEYSGRKDNNFYITSQVSLLIDQYIDNCQLSEDGYCNMAFPVLQQSIISDKSGGKHSVKHDIDLQIGEVVNIVDGPFKGFEGSVSEIDSVKGKIKVLVSMFGRDTSVELDVLQVKKI